jgi:hypothetical protein
LDDFTVSWSPYPIVISDLFSMVQIYKIICKIQKNIEIVNKLRYVRRIGWFVR